MINQAVHKNGVQGVHYKQRENKWVATWQDGIDQMEKSLSWSPSVVKPKQ